MHYVWTFLRSFAMVTRKKKKHTSLLFLLFLTGLGITFSYMYRAEIVYVYYHLYPPKIYSGFGTELPDEYTILGVDVSKYQKHINWKALSDMNHQGKKLSFAFIKASEGKSIIDPLFSYNAHSGKKSRLYVGAYHFYRFNVSPSDQMQLFLQTIKEHNFSLPPVIDVETEDGDDSEQIRKELQLALEIVENECKRKPIIYTNPAFFKKHLAGHFSDYSFWVAHYYVKKPLIPATMNAHFWQITDKATVDGIQTPVDLNVFLGTNAEFMEYISSPGDS